MFFYAAPEMEVTAVEVEKGFADSIGDSVTEETDNGYEN